MYTFKDFSGVENYVYHQVDLKIFPVGTVCSLPMIIKRDNRVFRAVFIYEDNLNQEGRIKRPFAWAVIPTDNKFDYTFSWCSTFDFMLERKFSFDSMVSAYLPNRQLSKVTIELHKQEAIMLLDEISSFAFNFQLSDSQQKTINRFKELFTLIAYQGLYEFYYGIAPDFFKWIDFILIAESNSKFIEEQKKQDLLRHLEEIVVNESKIQNILLEEVKNILKNLSNEQPNNFTLPMERDIILIIDHIRKNIEHTTHLYSGLNNKDSVIEALRALEQDLTDVLYRQGVDPYIVESPFVDVSRQKIIETVPTSNPSLDKTIAIRIASGWIKKDKIVRPECIKVFLYNGSDNT